MHHNGTWSLKPYHTIVFSLIVGLACALTFIMAWVSQNTVQAQIDPVVASQIEALDIVSGSTFTFGLSTDISGLDPALQFDGRSFFVANQIYETLVDFEPGGIKPIPGLAESWNVSADGLTWTFNLRSGVTFHDGTVLDASAVVYNIERWWDPAHPYHDGSFDYFNFLFNGFKGDPNCLLSQVSAVGSGQVKIVLSQPQSPLTSMLTMQPFSIASPTAIQTGNLITSPVGSGPFKFTEWVADEYISMDGNPSYWGSGPRLEKLTFQVIPDDAGRFAALQSNLVQGIETTSMSDIAAASQTSNLQVLWRPATNTGYLGINRGHAPLDNDLVRQAIAHAINKPAIIDRYYNADAQMGIVATQLLPPEIWGHDQDLLDYAYDPNKARSLLTQAGYPQGFTTTLWIREGYRVYYPEIVDSAAAIQADLQTVGISANLEVLDSDDFGSKLNNGENDLFLLGWIMDYPHPHNYFPYHFCNGISVSFGPRDDTLCEHLESSLEENDFDTLVGMYEWASQRVHDTLPLVPISHGRSALLFRQGVVGFTPSGFNKESFKNVFFNLLISKNAHPSVMSGDPLTYTLTVTNPNGLPATNVTVSDTLPTSTHYISGGTVENGKVTWSGMTIAAGQSIQVSFVVTTSQSITNEIYGANSTEYYPAVGDVKVPTAVGTASMVAEPTSGGTMTDASAGVTTTVLVPANAVATETELIFVPVTTAPETPPDTFSFAGYAFSIDAYQNDEYVPYLTLDQPVILTIEYDDNAIGEFDESMLTLTYWDGVQWTEQGITIVDRDQENNQLVVSIMHLTDFAMFGKTYIKVYLPLVIDNP